MKNYETVRWAAVCLTVAGIGLASADARAADADLEQLRAQIEAQQRQINALKGALDNTRRNVEKAAKQADQASAKADSKSPSFLDSIDIGGVAEVEATNTKSFADADTSDIALAKVELFVDAQPHEYLGTHVQFVYEDDGDETIQLDEANFTFGNTEKFPVYLMGGKWVMPFGGFDTDMNADPLTQSLGEVKEAALLLGATEGGATIEGYAYNGDTQKAGEGDNIDQFGVSAGYGLEADGVSYNAGIGYISNFGDSDGLTDGLGGNATALDDYTGGVEVHGDIGYGGFVFRGGYMTAVSSFAANDLAFDGQGAKPSAWTTEAAYSTSIMGKDTTFAATVQGTREALALGLPELRVGGAVTVGLVEHLSVTGEYLHDEDYSTGDGGTGNDGHTATLKFAAEF